MYTGFHQPVYGCLTLTGFPAQATKHAGCTENYMREAFVGDKSQRKTSQSFTAFGSATPSLIGYPTG